MTDTNRLTNGEIAAYHEQGYHVARGVFTRAEMQAFARHFDEFAAAGQPVPGHWMLPPDAVSSSDPLARYPRVMNPHKISPLSRQYLIEPRLEGPLAALLGEEPVAIQSMFYWKPPGARGQAFHQDNFYARVKPASCMAGWVAVDDATPENGGLYVVPGSQRLEIQCPEMADTGQSFYPDLVRPPPGTTPVPVTLAAGDVLFFEGHLIHGSNPNRSTTAWRRSHVCHYMRRSSTQAGQTFLPAIAFDGSLVDFMPNGDVGPCGGREGTQALSLA